VLQRPVLLAHRGAHSNLLRENSLAALVAGTEQCDGVEFDVRFSVEGIAVIVHDETLDRIFGVPRRVNELTTTELAAVGIPTLVEVLAAIPPTALIDLELKEQPTEPFFAALVAARGPEAAGVVVSSFYPDVLRTVEERAPDWSRWLNAETVGAGDQAIAIGCAGLSIAIEQLSNANIERWHEAGLEVAAWTVRGAQDAAWASHPHLVALCVEGDGISAARAATR
jgi:myo-inositol-1(or 4)-monophosphatase/deoxyribonuclease-2